MPVRLLFTLSLLAAFAAAETVAYQNGTITQMRSVTCSSGPNPGLVRMLAGSPDPGTDNETCREYQLEAEQVIYRIIPRKRNLLLPLGDAVEFAISKNDLLIRFRGKKQTYRFDVVFMTLRPDENK